ncbi:MAG: hypothetical protein GXY76_08510 [Chloroflexi bacterium]|nr:hypothetical protein [Chloroflexota bacterium]
MTINKHTPLDQAWREAIDREQKAYEFYRDALEIVADTSLRDLFEFLMKEEEHHAQLLRDEFEKGFIQEM